MATDKGKKRSSRPLRQFYAGLFRRVPWWAGLLLGLLSVLLGVALTAKPFTSLGVLVALVAASFVVTGVSELSSAHTSPVPWIDRLAGAAWVIAGVVAAAWSGITIHALAILVGISLLVGGLAKLVSGIRGRADDRLISALSGLARVVFGILALSWPDVTVLVLALLVGPAMILFGLGQIAAALRRRAATDTEQERYGSRWPGWLRLVGAAASLVLALGLLTISAKVHRSSSQPDAFYAAPSNIPSTPGALLRSEPFTRAVPEGARAWRILYTTTRDDRTSAVASAIVLVSKQAPSGPRPVIAWAHGTTGFASKCAPSLLKDPFAAGALPALDQIVSHGWVLVATDYVGLGTKGPHPYLIGEPVARSVLDSVRAARQLEQVDLERRTIIWGHSQGGGAALWTGILAPTYAPDANVIGVAALAPATELPPIFDAVKDSPVGKIMGAYVISAYGATYPDVQFNDYVRPAARVLTRETAGRCLSGPEALVSVATAVPTETVFSRSPSAGALGKRLAQNIPNHLVKAPLLLAQGQADALVLPNEQGRFVKGLCAKGQALEYRTYKGYDHVGVVLAPNSPLIPDLISWTEDRLAGTPQPPGCRTVPG